MLRNLTISLVLAAAALAGAASPDRPRGYGRSSYGPARAIGPEVVAVDQENGRFTVLWPSRYGGEPRRAEYRIVDSSVLTYGSVAPGGAEPTIGYHVVVRVMPGTDDAVDSARFTGPQSIDRGEVDVAGRVAAVSEDGMRLTIQAPGKLTSETENTEVLLSDATELSYTGIATDGARPTVGYTARVWLGEDHVAAAVSFAGFDSYKASATSGTSIYGHVTEADGRHFVVQMPIRSRQQEPRTFDVPITADLPALYMNVGRAGARPIVGYMAELWLDEQGKVTMARFSGATSDDAPEIVGRVIGVSPDGRGVAIACASKFRAGPAEEINIRIVDDTKVVFDNVAPNLARPLEGYQIQVWLTEGSPDVAARVLLEGMRRGK